MASFDAATLHATLAALPPVGRLWIGLSGGLDSTVLLHAAASLRGQLPGALHALHLDHGLHPHAPRWAEHCRQVCGDLDVPLTVHRLVVPRRPGASLEASARAARYQAAAEVIGPGEALVTAHHRDDQAETLLLALLRGSGLHGLAAMPAAAPLGSGWLLRPLLDQDRTALLAYARQHRLAWIDDPSNADLRHDRNRLRQQVLPMLRLRWPGAAATIARSAAHCAEAAALIDASVAALLPSLAGSRPHTLAVGALRALAETDPARARALLRHWLRGQGHRPPPRGRLAQIIAQVLPARADAAPLVTWTGCEVRRYRDDLFVLAPLPPAPAIRLAWDGRGSLALPAGLGRLRLTGGTAGPVGAATAARTIRLEVWFGHSGLRCRRPGAPGQRLKHCFQQAGVPPWLRPYVPLLLAAGREDPALIAIAGVADCAAVAPGLIWEDHPWTRFGLFQVDRGAEPCAADD
ncbi:MAG: tRNA lysidine(34) synthetase TilS [Chromatiaceae bacterium]|nr:MAG: tRNA lysidine(34) synthetase TilS [Chromatiaceae bacterium]